MTKKQILGFKPAPRLEQVDNEHSERMEEHRLNDAMILPHDANLGRMEFSERTASLLSIRGRCLLVARRGHPSMSDMSLLSGAKPT